MNLTGSKSSSSSEGALKLPLWTKGETNAFFGLGFNILVNVLTLTSLLIFVVQLPAGDVLGTVLPGAGHRDAGRQHLLHLPGPTAGPPGEPDRRHRAAVRAERPAHVHRRLRHHAADLPEHRRSDAGLGGRSGLGVRHRRHRADRCLHRPVHPQDHPAGGHARHPGRHLAHLHLDAPGRARSGRPPGSACRCSASSWSASSPTSGCPAASRSAWPRCWSVPRSAGSAATCRCRTCEAAVSDIAIAIPTLHFDLLFNGLGNLAPLLATAIPLGVYNFAEAMSNVESAAAAGDSYNLRSVLLADGGGAIIGSALGSPFPPAVYIGHPGWKAAGGRGSYSMASGIFIALLCFLGLFGVLNTVLPIPAIVPILLYIGLLIGAQAFQSVPKIQAAAVVAAILPNLASWGTGLIDNALAAAGTTATEVGAGGAGQRRPGLQRAEDPRRGRGAGRHGARLHRRLHPDAQVLCLRDRRRRRRGAELDRPDPRQLRCPGRRNRRSRSATRCSASCWWPSPSTGATSRSSSRPRRRTRRSRPEG